MAPQSITWSFCWPSPSPDQPWSWPNVKYAIWQLETLPDSSTQLRGYVRFTYNKRLGAVAALLPEATWLPCVGPALDAFRASLRDSSLRVEGTWTVGKERVVVRNPASTYLPLAIAMLRDGGTVSSALLRYPELSDYFGHLQSYSRHVAATAGNNKRSTKRAKTTV